MELGLDKKVAVVTGGSKGIGFATALQLAKEGANIAICARNEEPLLEAKKKITQETGVEVFTMTADVTVEEDCNTFISHVAEHFGRLDILINNAGTTSANPFEAVETELWQKDLNLKLFAAIHCSQFAIPYMRKNRQGAILNVTAILGKTPRASSLPTSVSRGAGLSLTKAMSKDLGTDNIRVNTVCIGMIRSEQIEKIWKKTAPNLSFEEFSKQYSMDPSHEIPLGRIGETDEAAKVITFLVSDAASYISGSSLNIDGGMATVL